MTRDPAVRASSSVASTRSTCRREVLLTWQWCIVAPVSAAAIATSVDPSTGVLGSISIRSRTWVKVGAPAADASRATARYSPGSERGAYPSRTPTPSAPAASSPASRSSHVASSAGDELRCQSGLPRSPRAPSTLVVGTIPASTWPRACAQEAEKP